MPTKYCDRLHLPEIGNSEVAFFTKNGLKIAQGYKTVSYSNKPVIEFTETQIDQKNVFIPENKKWKIENKAIDFIEYRSKDFCNIKILKRKIDNKFFISVFDLTSNKFPILISPLHRKKTILAIS